MHSRAGSSFFTYSLARPFPARWVTPVVVVGGVVLTILFSFVAVASNAYELQSIYATDPNVTEARRQWFEKTPFSWFNSLSTQCQSSVLTVGASYKTANRGFSYTLSGIEGTNDYGAVSIAPSASYKNTPLQDCEVANIQITLARFDNTPVARSWWTWGASTAAATVRCSLHSSSGPLYLNFTATLPPVGSGTNVGSSTAVGSSAGAGSIANLLDNFVYQNDSGRLHMYYGMQLTASWYALLPSAISLSDPRPDLRQSLITENWGTGNIKLQRNPNTSDYTAADFFLCAPQFSTDQGGLRWMPLLPIENWTNQSRYSMSETAGLPNISMSVDAFAKSYYSLLLSDFNVNGDTNALASRSGIDYLQSRQDTELAAAALGYDYKLAGKNVSSGVVAQVLVSDSNPMLKWSGDPAYVFISYLCSVPRRKTGMSLIFPVLVADIVFLQACWKLFILITTWWLGRGDKEMNYCAGCLETKRASDLAVDDFGTRPSNFRSFSERSELQELIPMRSQGRN